ncbi:MAG: glycosyltransferase family 39 protein, partial [Anaerolineae bacterium]
MSLASHLDTRTRQWFLAAILVLAAALRFWRLGEVALIGDESYYWLWSERLALSYYDNPAGVALMVRLSTWIGGQGEAGIRWLNALLGVGAVFLVYQVGARLLSEQAALLAAALLAIGAPYLIVSRFAYPDALQLALLLLNILALLPFLLPERQQSPSAIPTWRFWAVALSTAALLNSKYNAYLYALAMATFLALCRPSLLRDRRTWWAAGMALLGLLPAVAWNAAYGWASYRWQFAHFTQGTLHRSTLLRSAWHAARYMTFPLTLVALVGVTQMRGARRQALYIPALVLVLPIVLSPADSPRNLVNGSALLLLLGSDALCRWTTGLQKPTSTLAPLLPCVLALLVVFSTTLYGLGTLLETLHATTWPHSPVATALRQDGLGWRHMPDLEAEPGALIFAVDYSIASQLRYYTGLPVQTSWGQYRLWGIPELERPVGANDAAVILALTYVEPDLITKRLEDAFSETAGPAPLLLREGGETKPLNVWTARGRQVDADTFLHMLDVLDLAEASQAD